MFSRYYATQKKTLEVNPRHPLIKELLKRVEANKDDQTAKDLSRVLLETATLRSGYLVKVSLSVMCTLFVDSPFSELDVPLW